MCCLVGLKKEEKKREQITSAYLLVNCPKMGMLSSDPSKEFMDTE